MGFIRGIVVSRLKKIRILPYLVLVKSPLQYWVQFWLSHFKRHGGETGQCLPVGCQDDRGLGHVAYRDSLKELDLFSLLKGGLKENVINFKCN